jgi:hypothetical protein
MEDIVLIKLKEAIEKKQVTAFINGKGSYQFTNDLLETPTNLDTIFLHGFNKYAKSKQDKEYLHQILTQSLIELTKSPIGLWWCISFIHNYYLGFHDKVLQFSFDTELVVKEINEVVLKRKEYLIKCKDFVGYRFENGLWENIANMVNRLNEKVQNHKILI